MTFEELNTLYQLPLFDLIQRSRQIHEEIGRQPKSSSARSSPLRREAAPKIAPTALNPLATKVVSMPNVSWRSATS